MPVEYGISSEYAKEMKKWNAHHSEFGAPGRPYQYRAYPKMLYVLEHSPGKGATIKDRMLVGHEEASAGANEEAERLANTRGFYEMTEAKRRLERDQTEHGRLAAQREFAIQHGHHTEHAIAEVRAAEDAHGARHLPDVPETPIKRRGRKPTAASAVTHAS